MRPKPLPPCFTTWWKIAAGRRGSGRSRRNLAGRSARSWRGCTDTDQTPKPPWRERKEKYIAHLDSASASTRLVSASDKLHNARAIVHSLREDGDEIWQHFKGGKEGALWYYRALVTAFRRHGENALIAELDRVVTEMEELAAGGAGGFSRGAENIFE